MKLININYLIFSLIFVLAPINIFVSGLPQLHHYLFLILFFNFIFYSDKIIELLKENKYIIFFFLYTLLLNIFWFIVDSETSFIKGAAYNFFNLLVFLIIQLVLYNNKNFINYLTNGIYASVLIQYFIYFLFIIVHSEIYSNIYELDRLDLLSKSKNTLGFILLFFSIIVFINFNNKVSILNLILKYIILFLIAYLLISNRSLGSLFGFLFLLSFILFQDLSILFKNNTLLFLGAIFLTLLFFILSYNLYEFYFENSFINLSNTITSLGSRNDESFIGRGYGILLQYPEMLIFGAGDADVIAKFNMKVSIHSLLVHIIFSYGIIGMLFLLFHLLIKIRKNYTLILVVIFSLSPFLLTHNTMKNSFFWFIFALISYIGNQKSHINE